MKNIAFHTAVAALLCSLSACSPRSVEQQANGKVKFTAKALTVVPVEVPGATSPLTICADFTLQPVSINAAGNQTPAGDPVSISSTGHSQTDAILGCIDAQDATINPNWGYQVTASHFVNCATGLAVPGLSPSVAFANPTVQCTAGKDMPLNIVVNVSVATPNAGGYIDISVNVNETDVQVGCKDADFVKNTSILHFGESYIDPHGAIPLGLIGLDTGSPQQWAGTVSAGAPAVDSYYTGAIDVGQSNTSLVYQTFVAGCANGQQYADAQHAQCITKVIPGDVQNSATTVASLADAFMESVNGFAAASVSADQSTINLISNYSAAPLLGDASVPKTNYNQGTKPASVSLAAPDKFTGVFVDQSKPDLFLATALIGGVPSVTTLVYGAAGWTLGAWKPLASFSSAEIACHGLFTTPAGCFALKDCATSKAQCTPEQTKVITSAFEQLAGMVKSTCAGAVSPSLASLLGTNSTTEFCSNQFDTLCLNSYLGYVKGAVACSAIKPMSAACTLTRMEQGILCGCR